MKLHLLSCSILLLMISACSSTEPDTTSPAGSPPSQEQESEPVQKEEASPEEVTPPDQAEPAQTAQPEEKPVESDPPARAAEPNPTPPPPADPAPDEGPHPGLLDPSKANETAPQQFRVKFETTKGDVVLQINRSWSPRGSDRFYNLVRIGFFTDTAIFRVIQTPSPFMAQFGIHGDPKISAVWDGASIQDDPVQESNLRGRITFATGGPNTRTTQFFINFANNAGLDRQGFSPFGEVVEGMDIVDSLYSGYGDGPMGPNQSLIMRQGNSYLKQQFGKLDYIKKAELLK